MKVVIFRLVYGCGLYGDVDFRVLKKGVFISLLLVFIRGVRRGLYVF